ncbi:hypothetical protein CsSME_00003014 [Camellia sinensis var. sinensis]
MQVNDTRVVGASKTTMKNRNTGKVSPQWIIILCIFSFAIGTLFTNRLWAPLPESNGRTISRPRHDQELQFVSDDSITQKVLFVSPSKMFTLYMVDFDSLCLFLMGVFKYNC